jgi:thioredoxin reductase (NADPH)
MVRDLIIIGTGPAGLTAGLQAGRYDLDTILFERQDLGGGLVNRHTIETYPGFPDGISGPDLRSRIVEQLRTHDLHLELAEVTALTPGDPIRIETASDMYESKTVILTTGGKPKRLACSGADQYDGKGIFFCALCDGPLYQDERIGIVGNGELALMDSVFLTDYASEILLITECEELSGSTHLQKEVIASSKINVYYETEVTGIVGDSVVTGVELHDGDSGDTFMQNVNGLLVQLGLQPNTGFLSDVITTTEQGEVVVDNRLATNVPGVFAAGTVRENSINEVASAVGDGIRAFHSARQYLDRR